MQPVSISCRAASGLAAPAVNVEVFLGPGLPGLNIVGLVETAVKESRDRVRAAIQNAGFDMPDKRITVNLAPADLPKTGSRYDLAIAIGILSASRQVATTRLSQVELFGELSLGGELRYAAGALPFAMNAIDAGKVAIVPEACAGDAGLLDHPNVLAAKHLASVAEFLNGTSELRRATCLKPHAQSWPDLADVQGQLQARRALEIAAVGNHNLLLIGPPGTGKSMLAERLPGLLRPQTQREALETAALYSLVGIQLPAWKQRPFRSPHHTASVAAIAGGNANPRPGEVSLAHNGVLFLDELPEFQRAALEVLREPLETGTIAIARARGTVNFPARFQLVAAMNPCQCGYLGDAQRECRCTPDQVQRYRQKVSGPFLDRIDIAVFLHREAIRLRAPSQKQESSAAVRARVEIAQRKMLARGHTSNSNLNDEALRAFCWPDPAGQALLETAANKLALSQRACHRILRVARSIADLDDAATPSAPHIAEALNLRQGTRS